MSNLSDIQNHIDKSTFQRLKPWLTIAIGTVVLALAVWVIYRDIHTLSIQDIYQAIRRVSSKALFIGVALTFLSYIFLIFYDWMAAKYAEVCMSWHQTSVASFCSYVISHNLGCAAITGAAVRYRMYRSWGTNKPQVASIIGFCSLTFFVGILGLIVLVTAAEPQLFARLAHMPVFMMYIISAVCVVIIVLYVALCRVGTSFRVAGEQICLPKWRLAVGQLLFGMTEMTCTAGILWAFLGNVTFFGPYGLNFLGFLGIYLAGYFAGVTAGTPSGLGVFDGFILVAVNPFFTNAEIIGALFLFRLVYSLIPFVLATLLFGAHEMNKYRKQNTEFSFRNFLRKDLS